jgi:hypothetical protein
MYEYFRVGSAHPSNEPFGCNIQRKITEIWRKCNHHWLVLEDTTVPLATGEKKLAELKDGSKFANFLSGVEDEDLPFMAFGSKFYWCAKCGLAHKLHPLNEHLLPKAGMMAGQ